MEINTGKDRRLLLSPLFLITCFCFCVILFYRLVLAFFPMSNSAGSENGILYFIQRVLDGNSVYTDPSQPVYAIAQYTPLYYYFIALIAKILSIHANNVLELFIVNRITALLLDLGLGLIVGVLLKNIFQTRSHVAYITGMVVFIFLPSWSRVDNLYIFFWFASLYFFLKTTIDPNKNLYLLLSVLAGILSVLSKQSGCTILVVSSTWLLATRQYKRTVIYCVFAACMLCLSLFILSISTNLYFFYQNVVLGVNNGISFADYFAIFVGFYRSEGLFFIISFVLLSIILSKQKETKYRFFLWILCGQFILTNIFALKYGSGLNYLTEWMVLIITILAAFSKKWTIWLSSIHQKTAMLIAAIVIIAKTSNCLLPMYWYCTPSNYKLGRQHFVLEKNVAEYLLTKKQSGRPFVITSFSSIDTYLCNLLPKQYLFPQSDIINTVYYRKVYDFSKFKTLAQQQVGYLVSDKVINSFKLYDANFVNLRKDTSIGSYFIYSIGP